MIMYSEAFQLRGYQEALLLDFHGWGWDLLYSQACKASLLELSRQQPGAADGDRLQQSKHKKTLILSEKGNLSKAYKQLTQEGFVVYGRS